jgi:hypothetical protein
MNKEDLVNQVEKVLAAEKDLQTPIESVFSLFDSVFLDVDDSEKSEFIELLNKMEEKVKKLGDKDRDHWMSEIYLRKSFCANGIFERQKEYLLWKEAYEYALKSKNYEVLFQAGHALGFDFYEFTRSLREILELQMSCVKAVCDQGTKIFTSLKLIGTNLFNFWRQIEFRRLSEHDLKAKKMVMDGAKSLEKADFDEERAAPIMIMLISKFYEYENPCLEWAQHESAIIDIPIPENIKKRIGA